MPTTLPFQRISDYQLVQELHRGDRSLVARARHEASGESVVIKMLSGDYPEPADIARFEQEFQIGRGLDSASVIDYLDRINHGNAFVLVVEDFGAESLAKLLARGLELELEQALRVGVEVARGLADIHAAHVIHKDISPGNILISRQGAVKLADFGVAVGTPTATAGAADNLAGKPHYFAPELWRGGRANPQTDVFALGVSFYEMLTLRPLFSRSKGLHGLAVEIAQEFDPQRLIEQNLTLPDGLEPILLAALAIDPGERYASALEFLEDVNDYAYESGIRLLDAHFASYIARILDGVPQEKEGRRRLFKSRD